MDARLLTGMEEERFRDMPDLTPRPTMTEPFEYQPGPTLAGILARQQPMDVATTKGTDGAYRPVPAAGGPGPSPAASIAQPSGQPATDPSWTPERRAFVKSVHDTAVRYKQTVESRRAQRKALSAYGKLKSQLDTAAGMLSDLTDMEKTYPDVYGPDSPATMALQHRKIAHFEKANRLRQELNQRAQQLNKQFGFKLGKNGGLADEDSLAEAGDQQFDDWMREGFIESRMSQPPGYSWSDSLDFAR